MEIALEEVWFAYRSKAFGTQNVFSGVTTRIASGEAVAVIGEEGSGKSTLLQLVDGLLRPDSGAVLLDRVDIWQSPKRLHELRRRVGFAFQFPEAQFFCETVRDELLYAARMFGSGRPSDGEINEVLTELGLAQQILGRSPFALSMGEARRVALASVLLHKPQALLVDEPTAGLDSFGIECVHGLLRRLTRQGTTVVVATHDEELISSLAHRVIHVAEGKIAREFSLPSATTLSQQ